MLLAVRTAVERYIFVINNNIITAPSVGDPRLLLFSSSLSVRPWTLAEWQCVCVYITGTVVCVWVCAICMSLVRKIRLVRVLMHALTCTCV